MKYNLILATILFFLSSCTSEPVFDLPTSQLNFTEIVNWNKEFYFSDREFDIYRLEGDSLVACTDRSVVDFKTCNGQVYQLKSSMDSTLVIISPDKTEHLVRNKTTLDNKYFKLHLNESCEPLLEYGTVFFKIQEGNFIDYDQAYGFEENLNPNISDQVGYFSNFVFLTKEPGYLQGGLFQVFLDDSDKIKLPSDMKVRDFAIHNHELLIVTGYSETIGEKELIKSQLMTFDGNELRALDAKIPEGLDISRIFVSGEGVFVLSETSGFYKLTDNKFQLLISVNLRESGIGPESFLVDKDKIYLTTWQHGLLIFEGQQSEYDLQQIK